MLLELLFVTQAHALTLKSVPPANLPTLAGTPAPPSCDQLQARLNTFTANLQSHSDAMGSYLANLSTTIHGWYAQLQPLEGQQNQTLAKGTFDVLNTGGNDIDNLNEMASANFQYLQDDLAAIVEGISKCTNPSRSDRR